MSLQIKGVGTIGGIDQGLVVSGVTTATNFKTGSTNIHSAGVEAAGINVLGADTPIGVGATIYNSGGAIFAGTSGVVTATSFVGSAENLTGLPAGIGTALSTVKTSPLNKIYYTNSVLSIDSTVTVDHPASAAGAFTQAADIQVEDGYDLIVADGDDLIPDILGLGSGSSTGASGGRLLVDNIVNRSATGAPTFPSGAVVTGIVTATNVSAASSVTATTYYGSGANLTGISVDTTKIETGNTKVETIDTGTDGHVKVTTENTERLRIHANGRIEPKYSSSAPATGGIIMVGGFAAKPSAHHSEGVVQAKTNTNAHCFDAAGWYDNTNYRYTPKVKGHYIFYCTGMMYTGMNGSSCEQSIHIRLNGSGVHTYATGYSTNFGNYDLNTITTVIYCNGNTDYVDWTLSSNRSVQVHSASMWSGFLLYPAA